MKTAILLTLERHSDFTPAAAMRAAGRENVPLLALAKERVRGGEKILEAIQMAWIDEVK